MSILPVCQIFDYSTIVNRKQYHDNHDSTNFSTHDPAVPRISDVHCQRLTRELAYFPVLKCNEGLRKSPWPLPILQRSVHRTEAVLKVKTTKK